MQDRFGLAVTCASPAALALYVEAVDLLLSANDGALARLDAALRLAPDFALAHAARARVLQMYAQPKEAKAAADTARKHVSTLGEREHGHVDCIALLAEGRGADAWAAVQRHVAAFPRDALPLSLALGVYGLLGFSGRVDHHQAQRDLLEGLARHWDDDWWFLTYLGWARVETGEPALGVPLLDQALALFPHNAHGAHARAHACYELGEAEAGRRFIADWLPDYDPASQLHCHLTWHQALFALQLGDADDALSLYRRTIQPSEATSPPLFTLADAASLLWRMQLYGHDVGAQSWADVAALAGSAFPHAGIAFADVHAALASAAAGGDVSARIGELQALVEVARLPAGPVVPALARGIAAFAGGHYDDAARLLADTLPELDRIGGSHAQRDVVVDTLIVAYLKAGRREKAEAALRARCEHRAPHLGAAWLARIH
jgi:tetratricopeptide (TPR) repeat protein